MKKTIIINTITTEAETKATIEAKEMQISIDKVYASAIEGSIKFIIKSLCEKGDDIITGTFSVYKDQLACLRPINIKWDDCDSEMQIRHRKMVETAVYDEDYYLTKYEVEETEDTYDDIINAATEAMNAENMQHDYPTIDIQKMIDMMVEGRMEKIIIRRNGRIVGTIKDIHEYTCSYGKRTENGMATSTFSVGDAIAEIRRLAEEGEHVFETYTYTGMKTLFA